MKAIVVNFRLEVPVLHSNEGRDAHDAEVARFTKIFMGILKGELQCEYRPLVKEVAQEKDKASRLQSILNITLGVGATLAALGAVAVCVNRLLGIEIGVT
ncbi:MAG: hypothetical protein HY861_02730 [Chlamydiia bacterium]|nr:hypothetical protein [Chlamydiia bacterium]